MATDEVLTTTDLFFCESVRKGCELDDARREVKAAFGTDQHGPIVGEHVVTGGQHIWQFSVKTNEHAHLCVGVADASASAKPLTSDSGPCAWGLHLGKGKCFKSANSFKVPSGKALYPGTHRDIKSRVAQTDGSITVLALVDLVHRRLSFAIGDGPPIDTGLPLSEAVRPWVWLGLPGVGTVSVAACTYSVPPPEREASDSTATAIAVTPSGATGITESTAAGTEEEAEVVAAEEEVAEEEVAPLASRTEIKLALDDRKKSFGSESDSTSTSASRPEPEAWTSRGMEWLSGLQTALGIKAYDSERHVESHAELSA